MKISSRIKDFFPLVTAGSPGAIRIVILLVSNHILAVNEVAYFSSKFTLASAFVMLCGVGFGTIIIKEISSSYAPIAVLINTKIIFYVIGALCMSVLWLLANFNDFFSPFIVILFLVVSLSGYQISRSYLIGIKSFSALLVSDVLLALILLAFLLCIIVKNITDPVFFLWVIALSYLIVQICMVSISYLVSKEKSLLGSFSFSGKFHEVIVPSFLIGLSNFFSSGINFILPSLFLITASENMAVLASFSAACFSVISVLPRGVVNNHLSDLAAFISKGAIEIKYYKNVKKKIREIVLMVSPVVFCAVYGYAFYTGLLAGNYFVSFLFLFLLMMNFVAGQLSVVESTVIYFCGYEKLSLIANFIAFALVMACYCYSLFYSNSVVSSMLPIIIPAGLTLFCIIRWKIFSFKINGFLS